MHFYLGCPAPAWLAHIGVPAFVSRNRLLYLKEKLPRSRVPWAMDSGGFTQITEHGKWCVSPAQFVAEVNFYAREIGNLDWASPMDWMCEEQALRRSGKTVKEHQRLTLENFLELSSLSAHTKFIPVLQGSSLSDYKRHVDQYARAGVDLTKQRLVGVGSVCRRQGCGDATKILKAMSELGIRVHAFGLSTLGLRTACKYVASADSMAWSRVARGRYVNRGGKRVHVDYVLLPSHRHSKSSENNDCRNCPEYALLWRKNLLASIPNAKTCVKKHPKLRTRTDRAWVEEEARRFTNRPARKRGEPTPIELERLVQSAFRVNQVNALLDAEEEIEEERGARFGGMEQLLPKTRRAALTKQERELIERWKPTILRITPYEKSALRIELDNALRAKAGPRV